MTNSKDQAQSLFLNALEIPTAGERAAYVEAQCGEDRKLRKEVEELLDHAQRLGPFLESNGNGVDSTVAHPISEQPGTIIGPYKLLQQIGEGGMGVVFMAEQTEPIQRTVALKIIKPGMDTRQVIARFEAERQAVAMMDHPNIAKVLDAGTTDSDRPYFVMELVKGVPITKYCDEKQLPLRARLELFVHVCQAVQHAHQKGIIHRDIKPNNVLVAEYDNRAVPKVIDFGVAKATAQRLTERTMFTEFGQVLGTMEYMSPEQSKFNQLDIDTRSDIYSLGVLLYELLAGSTPFEGKRLHAAAFDEMLRIIREEEPPTPSTRLSSIDTLPSIAANRHTEPARLSKDVRGELDWIVMKALEKDRNRRYETASGFAADIERHLHDQPVVAGPPSAAYRFRKFAKRNKAALLVATAAIATLLLLVLGLAVSNRMIVAERNETAKALKEKEQALAENEQLLALAEAQRKRSDANFLKATVAVRDIITGTALGRDNVPVTLRRKFSDQATKFYESLLQEDSPDPSLLYDTAVGYRTIGMLHSSWGEFEQAEKSFRRAIDILGRLSTKYPAVQQYRHQLGYAHMEFARMLNQTGRSQEAQPVIERGIKVYEKLVAETPNKVEFLANLTLFYVDAITTHGNSGAAEEVEKSYRRVAELLEKMGKEALVPNLYQLDVVGRASVGHRQREVAFALRRIGRFDDAEQIFRNAVRTFEVLRSEDPGTVGHWHFLADTHRNVGLVMLDRKKPKEAEQEFRRAIEIHDESVAKFPNDRVNDLERAAAYFDLARLLIKSGRAQEAVPLVARGVEISPTNEGQADKLNVQIQLGNLLREAGEFDQALARYSEVIATNPDRAETWVGRGQCYLEKGEFVNAAEDFSAVIELYQKRPAGAIRSGELFTLGAVCRKYANLQGSDRSAQASELALKALPLYHAATLEYEKLATTPEHVHDCWEFATAYEQVAVALTQTGKSAAGEKALRDAQQIWMKLVAADNSEDNRWHLAINCELIGQALRQSDRLEMSVQSYQRALAIWEKLAAETHKEDHRNHVTWQRQTLVDLLRSQGKTAEAEAIFQKAEAECREAIRQHPNDAGLHRKLADVLRDLGKLDEAIAAYSEVLSRKPGDHDAWKQRGACYLRKGNLATAVEYFTEAIKHQPDDSWYWHERAWAYLCLGDHKNSIADHSKAIALKDTDAGQRQRRGQSYKALGDFQKAEEDFSRAIELEPRTWEHWYHRGQLYAERGQWDKSEIDFAKVIALQPERSDGWSGRAFAYFHLQQWDKAVSDFSKAIDLAPQVHANWLHRGHAYLQLAQWENAAADFTKVIEGWPDDAGGSYWRALAYAQLNHPDKALADLRQAIAKGYKNVEQLKNDPMLDPLRSDEDFKKLFMTLEKEKE